MKRKRKTGGKRSQNTQEKNEMTLAVCKRAYFERIRKKKNDQDKSKKTVEQLGSELASQDKRIESSKPLGFGK